MGGCVGFRELGIQTSVPGAAFPALQHQVVAGGRRRASVALFPPPPPRFPQKNLWGGVSSSFFFPTPRFAQLKSMGS